MNYNTLSHKHKAVWREQASKITSSINNTLPQTVKQPVMVSLCRITMKPGYDPSLSGKSGLPPQFFPRWINTAKNLSSSHSQSSSLTSEPQIHPQTVRLQMKSNIYWLLIIDNRPLFAFPAMDPNQKKKKKVFIQIQPTPPPVLIGLPKFTAHQHLPTK